MDAANVPHFSSILEQNAVTITRKPTTILQLNIGLHCNQACKHCHVESSPLRKEMMDFDVAEQCMKIVDNSPEIDTLDLTGGAPELNKAFRWLVAEGRKRGLRVIDRCNLTVLNLTGQKDLGEFLRDHQVNVVASMPCYSEENVRKQRGTGVFGKSILALQQLNSLGYGVDPALQLDLVYNPAGPSLPPAQPKLQSDYKLRLREDYGIEFNSLYTITNMPIKRYADQLLQSGQLQPYMELLVNNFNVSAAQGVMCRDTLSVMYDGSLYDCDFNQQIGLGLGGADAGGSGEGGKLTVWDLKSTHELTEQHPDIVFRRHCFGCTAGAGSSCQGATT
ncbi:radical SAM domain protein [Ochromonadaceae sp. CCMP2298]|nr:radical SAM domain protein [Ochromonadaceae sp. CCMP2298]